MKEKAWSIFRRGAKYKSDRLLGTVRAADQEAAEQRAMDLGMNGQAREKNLYAAPLSTARFTAMPESRAIGTFDFREYIPGESFETLRLYALTEDGSFAVLADFALRDRDPIDNPYLPVFKVELRGAGGR